MSNPGVKYLATKRLSNGVEFRVEDNIGEAIHIHYGDEIRLDVSINELLEINNKSSLILNELLKETNFNTKYFDSLFLNMISDYLINLERVEFCKIELESIKAETRGFLGLPVFRSIKKSRIVKALEGKTKEIESYRQENYPGQSNSSRLESMLDKISKEGYPFSNKYIVLFNDQNIVRDGQHRAGCLYFLNGNCEIDVIRMHFKNKQYSLFVHPWLKVLFWWPPKRIKKLIKEFVKSIISLFRRFIDGFKRRMKR